jgi:membrane protease YdiL (CAAX protease family)
MVALFCMVVLLGLASSFNSELASDQVSLGALSAVSFLLVTAALLARYPGGARLREAVGARPLQPMLLPLSLVIGLLAQAPAERLRDLVFKLFRDQSQSEPVGLVLASHSRLESMALVLVLVGLVPFAEEVFFRGAIYGALRRSSYSAQVSALVSAIGFTLAHVNLQLLIPIGFVALILSFLRASAGSLYPSLVAHMAFNALPVVTSMNRWTFIEEWSKSHSEYLLAALLVTLCMYFVIVVHSSIAAGCRVQEAEPFLATEIGAGQ